MAEALACRGGLILALELGVPNIVVETDCEELVQLWSMRSSQRSAVFGVLEEIFGLSLSFQRFSFTFANRVCNKVAHGLAKLVSGACMLGEWLNKLPTSVLGHVVSDCNPCRE